MNFALTGCYFVVPVAHCRTRQLSKFIYQSLLDQLFTLCNHRPLIGITSIITNSEIYLILTGLQKEAYSSVEVCHLVLKEIRIAHVAIWFLNLQIDNRSPQHFCPLSWGGKNNLYIFTTVNSTTATILNRKKTSLGKKQFYNIKRYQNIVD